MRFTRVFLATLFLGLLIGADRSSAATFAVPSDRMMVGRADAIVVGTVRGTQMQRAAAGYPETVTTISIEETIKGAFAGSSIDVHEPGGHVGDQALSIAGVPRFRERDRVLLFLSRTPSGTWAVTDLAVGKFDFRTDASGQRLLMRQEAEVVGFDHNGQRFTDRRRSADRFLAFLRLEASGGVGREDYFVAKQRLIQESESFTAAPSVASTSPTTYLTQLGGTPNRGGRFPTAALTYYKGTASLTGAPGSGVTAIQNALAAWTNDAGSEVTLTYGGVDGTKTGGLSGADGAHTILYERDLTGWGAPAFTCTAGSYGGVLGIGGHYAIGTHTGPNSETFLTAVEADVEMNQNLSGCTLLFNNNGLDPAVTHEVGHTLGFRHSDQTRDNDPGILCATDPALECSNSAIMTGSISIAGANLQEWDRNAVRTVYPGAVVPTIRVRGDIDHNAYADIVWHNTSTGQTRMWGMWGSARWFDIPGYTVPTQWELVATGDFNADGFAEMFWRNNSTGANQIWYTDPYVIDVQWVYGAFLDPNWKVVAVGDFSGDYKADLFFRNLVTGENQVWLMNNNNVLSQHVMPSEANLNWKIYGSADFDGDGKLDIFWRNIETGANLLWLMNGATRTPVLTESLTPLGWTPVAFGDMDVDFKADVVWHNASTGGVRVWAMNGATKRYQGDPSPMPPNWEIQASGDYNGDGVMDLAWRNTVTFAHSIWLMNGYTIIENNTLLTGNNSSAWHMIIPK